MIIIGILVIAAAVFGFGILFYRKNKDKAEKVITKGEEIATEVKSNITTTDSVKK